MQFRVRPSSKKSSNNQLSLVEFPTSKSLASNDSPLPRSLGARIDQLEASLNVFQEMYKRDRQVSNAGYVDYQKRLDKIEYKMFSAEQDLRQLNNIRQIKAPRQIVATANGQTSKSQFMLLKQVLMQEKDSQRQVVKHQASQIQQLNHKIMRQEQELRELIGQQRMQWEERISGQEEEMREIQGHKNRKIEQQYDMMKGIIANAEKKIYEQLQRKIRNQTVVKDFIENKLAVVKEEISHEHRKALASEAKSIRETKQSIQNLFSVMSTVKKDLSEQLAENQKHTNNSLKKLSMTLDITRQKASGQYKLVNELHRDVANELVELRSFVTTRLQENRQIMNEFQEQTLERIDNGGSRVNSSRGPAQIDNQRFSLFQKQINQWKSLTEQKNLNVFKEISNTLKSMKLQWRKENDQLVSEVAALGQSLKAMKKSGPNELKKSVQALVSIFNNEFDVLAEELQTVTQMIALAKKENEKIFKEELKDLKGQVQEEMRLALQQKGKECNHYAQKIMGRSQENTKAHINKEIKFLNQGLSQRMEKNEKALSSFDTSMKKANLLTASQLQDYSVKLKGFNDNYKEYLEEQRKDDMKKRMQLEENMRKNASNLMDVCYKKSEFLVQGLKNNIQIAQMKQKVEAAQALDAAKDELKKDVQGARQQWQKQLSQGIEKITKERQTSQEMLQETIQQSINNTKRTITNQIGNNKLELEQKINQVKKNQEQSEKEQEDKQIQLKNTVLQFLRDQKKLTQEKMQNTKKEVDDKMASVQQSLKDKEEADKSKQINQKKQMQAYVAAEVTKVNNVTKEELEKTKASLEEQLKQHRQETKQLITHIETDSKKLAEQKAKTDQITKTKEDQLQKKIKESKDILDVKIVQIKAKVEQLDKKMSQNQSKVEKENKTSSNEAQAKQKELQKQIKTSNEVLQVKIAAISTKIEAIDKKLAEDQAQTEQNKEATTAQVKTKQDEIEKKLVIITQDIDIKNKDTTQKIEEVNKKIQDFQLNAVKKEGQDKQVGQSSLKKVKEDLQKEIKSLSSRIEEIQSQDKGEDNEQAIASIRKSVNKLQAMVFSEQAKNKALFDRLTEDINKVSQNLTLLTNEMRQ